MGLTTYVGLVGFVGAELVQFAQHGGAGLGPATLVNALVWLVGVNALIIGSGHLLFPDPVAESIGWPSGSPFQWQVGLAGILIGTLGVLSASFDRGFQLAAVIAFAVFYLGAAIGHIREMVTKRNFATRDHCPRCPARPEAVTGHSLRSSSGSARWCSDRSGPDRSGPGSGRVAAAPLTGRSRRPAPGWRSRGPRRERQMPPGEDQTRVVALGAALQVAQGAQQPGIVGGGRREVNHEFCHPGREQRRGPGAELVEKRPLTRPAQHDHGGDRDRR